MAKGVKTGGGSRKGKSNKATAEVREALNRSEFDPFELMQRIARNELPCGVCRGEGVTRYALPESRQGPCKRCAEKTRKDCLWCSGTGIQNIDERTCQSCYKTLFEACSPELRGKMASELAQYKAPKLKATELTGKGGGPVQVEILEKLAAGRARVAAGRK